MSSQNPYEQLGVTEASSFDEIQDARNRLFAEYEGDRKQLESIEAAYDAVLMDRLRLRQEGKIKVPDRIRFPEKMVQPAPAPAPSPVSNGPSWLQRLIDTLLEQIFCCQPRFWPLLQPLSSFTATLRPN